METFKPKYFYSVVSVAISLMMLGLFGMIIIHGRALVQYTKEKVNIIVEIRNGSDQDDIHAIIENIKSQPVVKSSSIEYVSKDKALELISEDFGLEVSSLGMANPLYDVIVFNIKSDELSNLNLIHLKKELKRDTHIANVIYETDLISKINNNITNVTYIAAGASLLMLFIAIILINYTIRLVIYGDRKLIYNQEMVGASWRFIRRPYVFRAILNGLWSGLIAIAILVGVLYMANKSIPDLESIQDFSTFAVMLVSLVVLGVLISGTATYFAVNNYLKNVAL